MSTPKILEIIPETARHIFPLRKEIELSGETESFNVLLKRKGQFTPIATICGLKFPVEMDDDQKMILAAHKILKNFDIKLEPIADIDAIKKEFSE